MWHLRLLWFKKIWSLPVGVSLAYCEKRSVVRRTWLVSSSVTTVRSGILRGRFQHWVRVTVSKQKFYSTSIYYIRLTLSHKKLRQCPILSKSLLLLFHSILFICFLYVKKGLCLLHFVPLLHNVCIVMRYEDKFPKPLKITLYLKNIVYTIVFIHSLTLKP